MKNKNTQSIQIIIPMSGFGERFKRAGYTVPKPLIEIDGKPIIAHVINMFPGENEFIFICNQDHLANPDYHMEAILKQYCPSGKIIGIAAHKRGPIHAVQQVADLIDPSRPVVVNYCDFSCYWDWNHFKKFIVTNACAGAIPAYKGFHPHSLGNTNYAYLQEENGWARDIQEKKPFTDCRMNEFASSGTYYFASGRLMLEAFDHTVTQNRNVNGEYYVSLAYQFLFEKNLPVTVYPLQHFMQWGTPEDVAEYKNWSVLFQNLIEANTSTQPPQGSIIIPMAGLGHRFQKEGYTTVKPLIPVSGKPMVSQAINNLPAALHHIFVLREDMPGFQLLKDHLLKQYPNAIIHATPELTQGQACTALLGLNAAENKIDSSMLNPITFGSCDSGVLYNSQTLQKLLNNSEIDVIVWGIRGHTNAVRYPEMYGWINESNGRIQSISVKKPLASPATGPIVLGIFTFRRAQDFQTVIDRLVAHNERVNGEFYIDSAINKAIELGLRCHLFEATHFLSWGTPNELKTYEYWQSCFHKWEHHPYRFELDQQANTHTMPENLNKKITPVLPEKIK